jgi:hypothetical protein
MRRLFSLVALSSIFAAAPVMAKSIAKKPAAVAGDEAKPAEGEKPAEAKPKKTTKKAKKAEKTEKTETKAEETKPAETPAK